MAQTKTVPVFGKVITSVGGYYLPNPNIVTKVVPCLMAEGRYPAPVEADFTHVQHVVVKFEHPIQIEVDFGRITA